MRTSRRLDLHHKTPTSLNIKINHLRLLTVCSSVIVKHTKLKGNEYFFTHTQCSCKTMNRNRQTIFFLLNRYTYPHPLTRAYGEYKQAIIPFGLRVQRILNY